MNNQDITNSTTPTDTTPTNTTPTNTTPTNTTPANTAPGNNANQWTTFTFVQEPMSPAIQTSTRGRGRGRGGSVGRANSASNRESVARRGSERTPEPTPAPSQRSNAADNEPLESTESGNTTAAFDIPSQWVIVELFAVYYPRLELSSSAAAKQALYNEIEEKYNSNSNTNGHRSSRSITRKWNDLLRTYRRRKDQESQTGSALEAPWEFHEKMDQIASTMATVVPATVYSSFMGDGNTIDNRASGLNRRRNNGGRNEVTESVQQYINAMQEMNVENNARSQEHRDLLQRYLTSSIEYHSSSSDYMRRFLESRNQLILNQQRQHDQMLTFLQSAQDRVDHALERLAQGPTHTPPPPQFPSSSSTFQNNNPSSQSQSRKRRRSL